MSFMGYVQSLWGPSAASASSSSSGGGGLFSSPAVSSSAVRSSSCSGGSAQYIGSGVWPLSPQVREEMKKGTRYNMKVLLRGTKGTGKSTLLARLTGHPLPLSYTPSTELIASTMRLQGEHCAPHEGTKVDIWEVVEEGRQRSASSSSPNATAKAAHHIPSAQLQEALRMAADTRLLDVYAGAHLTIFMIDPRQRASWEYAKQETLHVPPTCCVLYALNFSDATSAAITANVPLAEVQAWRGRVRRATTSVVHRMLEGRQASEEFSVQPMTAVLSALSGAGIMGVIRALHVASTLLRIATEEVRVVRLFQLLARQQSVSIDNAAPQPNPTPTLAPTGGAGAGEQQTTSADDVSVKQSTGDPRQLSTHSGFNQPGGHPPAALQLPPGVDGTTALRMEHRGTSSSSVVLGDPPPLLDSHSNGASLRPLTEAEAMKLFLGSGSSGESNGSGRSSSSSSSSFTAGPSSHGGAGTPHTPRGVVSARQQPPGRPAGAQLPIAVPLSAQTIEVPSDHTGEGVGASVLVQEVRGNTSGPHTDAAAACESGGGAAAAGHTARPPETEAMCALAANMVLDAEAPADDFFREVEGSPYAEAEANGEPATPAEADAASSVAASFQGGQGAARNDSLSPVAEKEGDGLRARPLWTQRVVRTAPAAPPPPPAGDAPSALQKEVSTILAQMTAALSASSPQENHKEGDQQREEEEKGDPAAAAENAHPADNRNTGDATGEKRKKGNSSKHHRDSKDGTSRRHGHAHHGKHRSHRRAADGPHEGEAENVTDDGSFELVVT